jgi:2-oxoglutarate-dependent dioxygenase
MPESFVPELKLAEGEIKFYQEEGYLLLPGLISEAQATALRADVMQIMQAIGGFEGNKLKQTMEYLPGTNVDRLVNSDHLRDIAGQLMGGASSVYLPFTAVKGSGGGMFHFHQDNQYTHFENGMQGINLWIALVPMTPRNGCLMVVPRSHRSGTLESELSGDGDTHRRVKYEPSDFLPVRMRPGDCIAFSRLTVHGSGPNQTPDPRVAYAVQFNRDDAHYLDGKTGERISLKSHPRFINKPVETLSVPVGKTDGH